MAFISDTDIARVRESTDLVALVSERVLLKQRGRLFWGNCPFHDEKTPSFKVDPDTQLFHCFGCGAGGDAFGYLMRSEQLEFPEAVQELAERAHITLDLTKFDKAKQGQSSTLRAVCKATAEFYNNYLRKSRTPFADTARKYLATRGYSLEDSIEWQLGAAPGNGMLVAHLRTLGFKDEDMVSANVAVRGSGGVKDRFFNRVVFPVSDQQGRVIAFGGRIIGDGMPKYLNTSETPIFNKSSNMYGVDKAKSAITKTKMAFVVEGYTDVIALHKAGYSNTVATLGTALTAKHVKLLSRYTHHIIYVFDGDEAGLNAAERAVEFIDKTITAEGSSNPVVLDVVVLPKGEDPASIIDRDDGKEYFEKLIAGARPLITFAIDRKLQRWDLSRPEERSRALTDAVKVLIPLKGTTMASDYSQYIVDRLWSAGIQVELSQVLSTLSDEEQKLKRYGRESGSAQMPNINEADISKGAQANFVFEGNLTAIERLSNEIISFAATNMQARGVLLAELSADDFSNPHDAVFAEVMRLKELPQNKLLSELSAKFAGIEQMIAAHQFEDIEGEQVEEVAVKFAQRLKEMQLESRIRLLTTQLQRISDDPQKTSELISQIRDAQLVLNELRTGRHLEN